MIPNVGDVHQYLSTWTQDFARSLLRKLEEEFATIAKVRTTKLQWLSLLHCTACASCAAAQFRGTSERSVSCAQASIIHLNHMDEAAKEDIPKLSKRLPGRMAKCKGDLCLLAGSPVDALD